MSDYRDHLPAETRPLYDEAVAKAGELLWYATDDLNEQLRVHGPGAVAEAAHQGGRSVEEIEAKRSRHRLAFADHLSETPSRQVGVLS